jgi:CheY-like chemotaxis protein
MEETLGYFQIYCETNVSNGPDALLKIESSNFIRSTIRFNHYTSSYLGMDGIRLLKKKIKSSNPGVNHPFILMLSSLEKNLYQYEADKSGINKFISKPVKLHELNSTLFPIVREEYAK